MIAIPADRSQEPGALVAAPERMAAVVQDRYGTEPEEVLRLDRIAVPTPGDDDVLVQVRAAAVDRGTWHLMTGRPYLMRVAGVGVRAPKVRTPGHDLAGVVVAVGAGVNEFAPGDEVFGTCDGSFAEYALGRPARLAIKPSSLSFEEAAAVPVSGLTALQALRDRARVGAGERVLIIGALGGVGSFAVQIAKAFGAEVTGVCRTTNVELVSALGADHVIDHTQRDIDADGVRYDAILDIGGNRPISLLRRSLTPNGRLVIVGGETGGRWLGGIDRQLRAMLLSPFVGQKLGTLISSENGTDLQALRELIDAGSVAPAVDRTYPLAEAVAAVRHLQDGRARGKVVVTT